MRRYDIYGFTNPGLEDAAAFVESALGIHLRRRDSSYRGIYYCASVRAPQDYLLEANEEGARWYSQYPHYGVTLMVNDLPDMDAIRAKLTTGDNAPVFLHSIIHTEEPPDEYPADDDEE